MNTLPNSRPLPDCITLEPPATGLAGLAKTDGLVYLANIVVSQWRRTDLFEKLAKHKIFPIRNVLFYGPPGNGKTTACQWLASEIESKLYRVRCEALVGSTLGSSARLMRECMDFLARSGKCVVLFDEVETIFPDRKQADNTCGREIASAMQVFWQMLDRWTTPQLFCFATNLPDRLDKALLSRFELKLEFGPPSREQIESVVAYWSEVFHEFQPETWAPETALSDFESYRDMWQSISQRVRAVAMGMTGG